MRRLTQVLGTSLVLVSLLGISACSKEPQAIEVTQPPKPTPYPALSTENVQAVLRKVNDAVVAGDKANSAAPLKDRVSGSALAMRTAQYKLHAGDKNFKIAPFPTQSEVVTQTASIDWPKAIINVTKADSSNTKYIQVIRQETATDPYRMWQWMRLLPDADETATVIPNTDVVAQGSKLYDPNQAGKLVMSPKQAAQLWAEVSLDKKHKNAKQVVLDKQTEQMRAEQAALAKAIGDSGTLKSTVQLDKPEQNLLSFGVSYDKGALVAVTYRYTTELSGVKKEKPVVLNKAVSTIAGKTAKITSSGSWTSLVTVLLWVPAKEAKSQKIQALGADQVLIEAKI